MILYQVEILEVKSGEVKRVDANVGWTEYSPKIYLENMCDCNLGGCRDREINRMPDGQLSIQAHEISSSRWRSLNGPCDHSMPPKRLKAIKAHLSDGRVYDFETGAYSKKAAA